MKFIPNAIARKVARQSLVAKQHSPTILFGAGVAGMVGSTVLACRATLKLEEVLDEIEANRDQARQAKAIVEDPAYTGESTYTDDEMRRDQYIILVRGATKIVKLYAPAVLLGAASIAALTKSHSILQDRNIALTAAYVAVDEAFKTYRARVVDRYGEETDRELRYSTEDVDIVDDETGEIVSTVRVDPNAESQYARYFDTENRNWSKDPEINLLFLRSQQNSWNDVLYARGHVFLNEVYDSLGLSHTTPGSIVGWVRNSENGDSYIDFGVLDGDQGVDFFNGREGAILLDFNVDGVIWDKIDPTQRSMKWVTGHE